MRLETSDWQAEAFKSLVRAAFEFNSVLKETLMYTLEIVVLFRCKFAHSRKYSFSYLKSYHFHDGTKRSRSSQIRKNLKSISILLEAIPASEVVRMNLRKLNKSRPGPATASSVKKGFISASQKVMLDLRLVRDVKKLVQNLETSIQD